MLRILVSAVLAAGAFGQSPLERAVTLAREKRYAEARDLLVGVAEPSGIAQRIAFHRLKAAVASGLGEAGDAAGEMRAALELAPTDSGLLLATAAAELQAGLLDDALQHARSAGNSALAQALIGDIQEKRGEYVKAAEAYQAAVALEPQSERYRIALALELVGHHTFEPAITVLEQAAPLIPQSAKIRTLLGIAQYALGRVDDAVASLTQAVTIDPKLEPAYRYLAQVILTSTAAPPQRTVDALCVWDDIVCSAVKLRIARHRGDARLQAAAMTALERAPADSTIARCELGRAYESGQRWEDARTQMEACVQLDPTPQNHYRLGHIYSRLGLTSLARKQMELRNAAMQRMSEEVARRESAVQAFQYLVK